MTRAQLLRRLDAAWQAFTDSHAGLLEAELLEPGVTEAWSVRDIIAHVTTWEEEALTYLPLILEGGRPPRYSTRYGGIDAFNALMTDRKKDLPLTEVLRQRDEVHGRVVELVQQVTEAQVTSETRFRHRLRMDTYGHYPLHVRAIASWRRERSVRGASAAG